MAVAAGAGDALVAAADAGRLKELRGAWRSRPNLGRQRVEPVRSGRAAVRAVPEPQWEVSDGHGATDIFCF